MAPNSKIPLLFRPLFADVPESRWQKLLTHDRVLKAVIPAKAGIYLIDPGSKPGMTIMDILHIDVNTTTPVARTRAALGFTQG